MMLNISNQNVYVLSICQQKILSIYLASKRLRDSILSAFFHSYIFAMYKNEALWI